VGDRPQRVRGIPETCTNGEYYVSILDPLALSEQFDATTGFEKSVRNLTWSYAAFLSAVRARTAAASAAST
jgi:hypothetical protein